VTKRKRKKARPRKEPRAPDKAAPQVEQKPTTLLPRAARLTLITVAAVLVLLTDDRHVGMVADGRQMINTAVAIAETGEIGLARGTDFTLPRARGDAVSRFGMGTSLLQVPAAWLAPKVEAVHGPGSSQFLFLFVPLIGVLVTAWAAARVVLLLGAPAAAAAPAILLASVASPLGSYSAMEFSEPVQAAALGIAFAAALASARSEDRRATRLAAAAGAAAGFAVLTKSSLVIAAPWTLLPLLANGDARRVRRRITAAAAGALPMLVVWAGFELVRFGRLFGGYPDDSFTHSFVDGAWRLLIGPNRGLLLFYPAAIAAGLWAIRALCRDDRLLKLSAAAVWLPVLAMLAVAAPYWGWHGMEGWGPRLIVPAVALLAPLAAAWSTAWSPRLAWAVAALCAVINLAPLLQHPTPVATYVMSCRWPEVPPGKEAADFPFYARGLTDSGAPTVVPFEVLEREPAASQFLVYPWFSSAIRTTGDDLATRLAEPPWASVRPDIVPERLTLDQRMIRELAPQPRLGFLGRSLWAAAGSSIAAYDDALWEQVARAQQLRDTGRALELAHKLVRLVPVGESDALLLESFRLAGRRDEAAAHIREMPLERRGHPKINVVLALFERDAGNETGARAFLQSVVHGFPGAPAEQAVHQPLSEWPVDLHAMTMAARRDALVAAPDSP
jgi:hypothetical protein